MVLELVGVGHCVTLCARLTPTHYSRLYGTILPPPRGDQQEAGSRHPEVPLRINEHRGTAWRAITTFRTARGCSSPAAPSVPPSSTEPSRSRPRSPPRS